MRQIRVHGIRKSSFVFFNIDANGLPLFLVILQMSGDNYMVTIIRQL